MYKLSGCFRKIILMILVSALCGLYLVPINTYAKETKEISAEFQNGTFELAASSDAWNYDDIGPGDTFSYHYVIKNNTKGLVEVRLSEIKNGLQSELYPILNARLNQGHISRLSEIGSDWMSVMPGKEEAFQISVYFPEDADNQLQGKELHAQAVFEGRAADTRSVKTGDYSGADVYLILAVISLVLMLLLERYQNSEEKSA